MSLSVTGKCFLPLTVLCLFSHGAAQADTFGSGANQFEIPFVTIGSPGNSPDTTGAPNPAGSVPYKYRIGKYEVPEDAVRKANALSELAGDPLGITLDDRGPQKPATGLSWCDAARFVNWLNAEKGFTPAYKFDATGAFQLWAPSDPGYNPNNRFRNADARYFLPSVDEWYKAAFYDPSIGDYWDYPTGSNDPPTPAPSGTDPGTAVWNQAAGPADVTMAGGESPFGTVGQGGNVNEWEETAQDLLNDSAAERRGLRGGAFIRSVTSLDLSAQFRNSTFADAHPQTVGLRIVSVPVPSTASMFIVVLLFTLPVYSQRTYRRLGTE